LKPTRIPKTMGVAVKYAIKMPQSML
jgi:hypothetical protein